MKYTRYHLVGEMKSLAKLEIFNYRVMYDLHNWRKIMKFMFKRPETIPAVTRATLLDDAVAVACSGVTAAPGGQGPIK